MSATQSNQNNIKYTPLTIYQKHFQNILAKTKVSILSQNTRKQNKTKTVANTGNI